MRRLYLGVVVAAMVIIIVGVLLWNYFDQLSALKHETDRWVVIQDVNGDRIAVETTSDTIWEQLVQLHENKTERFVGSILEEYDNKWGFRFKPENITIAEVTVEGMQATIRHISEELDYWLKLGLIVYVMATVTEIHT
jgi:bifunctional pyridoxal-dependent enzyme with beta-cystathionase and maltose regulon repressor activities